jgi:hypothetical protein
MGNEHLLVPKGCGLKLFERTLYNGMILAWF